MLLTNSLFHTEVYKKISTKIGKKSLLSSCNGFSKLVTRKENFITEIICVSITRAHTLFFFN